MTEFIARNLDGELLLTKAAFKRDINSQDFHMTNRGIDDIFNEVVVLDDYDSLVNYLKNNGVQVTGPDPRTNRKWYANVTVNRLGNLKVS